MSSIAYKNADALSPPLGHYSHATVANGFVFVAGLLPMTEKGEPMTGALFKEQAKQVLSNLDAVLQTSGTDRSKLVQLRVYVTDIDNWSDFNQIYANWIGTPRPARCVVPVPKLHYGLTIELEAVALA